MGDPIKGGCKPRGECVNDRDCPSASACREGRCVDPCVAFCGLNAVCSVVNHQVVDRLQINLLILLLFKTFIPQKYICYN